MPLDQYDPLIRSPKRSYFWVRYWVFLDSPIFDREGLKSGDKRKLLFRPMTVEECQELSSGRISIGVDYLNCYS